VKENQKAKGKEQKYLEPLVLIFDFSLLIFDLPSAFPGEMPPTRGAPELLVRCNPFQ
jgi:hypothetical protein